MNHNQLLKKTVGRITLLWRENEGGVVHRCHRRGKRRFIQDCKARSGGEFAVKVFYKSGGSNESVMGTKKEMLYAFDAFLERGLLEDFLEGSKK